MVKCFSRQQTEFKDTFEAAFAVWSDRLHNVFSFARKYPEKISHLRLEDLVNSPVRSLNRVCEVLGVEFADLASEVSVAEAHMGRGLCRFAPGEVERVRFACRELPEMELLYSDDGFLLQ